MSTPILPPTPFQVASQQKAQLEMQKRFQEKELYIQTLKELLKAHGIEIPEEALVQNANASSHPDSAASKALKNASEEELRELLQRQQDLLRKMDITVAFEDLTFKVDVPMKRSFPTFASTLKSMICFWTNCEPKKEVRILSELTGRIRPRKMTLLVGPPGSGKTVLMKALGGRLHSNNLEGHVYYNGDDIKSGKFLPAKIANYVEQGDTLEAVLTVEETLKFAWLTTTGGHHSYARAKDEKAAAVLDEDDKYFTHVNNVLTGLGLVGCKDTYVGNAMIRGVSGGQKRRVTVGEMVVCPRPIGLLDSISNGLDAATTFDICRAVKQINVTVGTTILMSLLQPTPDVFNLFDEIMVLSEGQIVYHGPREKAVEYFERLGYRCPPNIDPADFLQELPTSDGRRFLQVKSSIHNTKVLAEAWKKSDLYQQLINDMKAVESSKHGDVESGGDTAIAEGWPEDTRVDYDHGFWYYFKLNLDRQIKVMLRNKEFIATRLGQNLVIGAITGSLFSNIATEDISTMNGFLFNSVLFGAVSNFAIVPMVYEQKAVFYKHSDALFYPAGAFTLTQGITLFPLQTLESIIYITITYWSAGLSDDHNGSRFFAFNVLTLTFAMLIGQFFRLISAIVPDQRDALPVAGIIIVVMVLFSGFIQPKSLISDGWIWFYWMNPMAWVLKGVSINEFKSPKYDFLTCADATCSSKTRFGDLILEQYGNPTDEGYVWYSFFVLLGEYLFMFLMTFVSLKYLHTVPSPPPPIREEDLLDNDSSGGSCSKIPQPQIIPVKEAGNTAAGDADENVNATRYDVVQLPFDQVSLAFKSIYYTVTLPNGEDVDLLRGVDGYFEPGTMTALMGSSGAGKTTLLDVLAGRKNTGVIKGNQYLNGIPKNDAYFRRIMGYVEQFDSLPHKSTAREAIAFSAALRLDSNITAAQRNNWVSAVLGMLDLFPLENELIGAMEDGGMSFEQRKRVSIGVELAANPSILFLDEPTTGLDSRAAQALIRNIRRIAASGRSIVCTIHQPSTAIFNSFDSLLLLRRGGQTVFFGKLGEQSSGLVSFFEACPGVSKLPNNTNPATWMLDIIGAGTGGGSKLMEVDYHQYYLSSSLHEYNDIHLQALIQPNEGSVKIQTSQDSARVSDDYNASSFAQFYWLILRIHQTYWRTPGYSFARIMVNVVLALIFASAYPHQEYTTYVATVSRASVIYITSFFCGVLSLITVIPVMSAERLVFYREQQSRMYSVWIYTITTILIEIPYIIVTGLAFTLPFFYIVGFDNVGNKLEKFFWYWCFQCAFQATMLFMGQFFVCLTPTEITTQVLGGFVNTTFSLFCGFLITQASIPTFWLFMYWVNPLHYCLEGIITAMFHGDTTKITTMNGAIVTAEEYIRDYQFVDWSYSHIGLDLLALGIFITLVTIGKYLCLAYMRHDKR